MSLIERKDRRLAYRIGLLPSFLILWVVMLSAMPALIGGARGEHLPIKTYTTADGLPRDHVNHIRQDSKGFIWFCTNEGLARFDGYNFANYGKEEGLPSREVYDFLESRDGTYWIATNQGLCRFIPAPPPVSGGTPSQRFAVYYTGGAANAQSINAICEDHEGAIWCATDGGLFRFDPYNDNEPFTFIDMILPSKEPEKLRAMALMEDRQNSLWVVAGSGLYRRWQDGAVEHYGVEEGLPEDPISNALLEDSNGQIWLGTAQGLYRLVADPKPHHPAVERRYTTKEGLADDMVTSVYQSSDGRVWIGTGAALHALSLKGNRAEEKLQRYTQANGLNGLGVTTCAEDSSHNLWLGTATGGVVRWAINGFTTYSQPDGLNNARIGEIFADRDDHLIIGDGKGNLNRFEGGRFTAVHMSLPKGMTYWGWGWYQTVLESRTGEWWVPTGEGLLRYPKLKSLEQIAHTPPKAIYTTRDGLSTNEIFRLYEDSRGDIWISMMGSAESVLTRWDHASETFHAYTPADGITKSAPTAFCEDQAGNLWIGDYEGVLMRYAQGHFTHFNHVDGVPLGLIRGLYCDHAGRLWVATTEGGVARIDDPTAKRLNFVTYSTANGLSSNQATCITEDQRGMIYIGTGRGLDKLDPATGHIRHFTPADGLANSFINVSFRDPDGSLWFGTLQGLSRLVPQPDLPTSPPPVLISGLRVAGVTYPVPEPGTTDVVVPTLSASQNHIQIDFIGLSLGMGETLRYQFKMEGGDNDWSPPTDQRSVNYPDLPSGSYRFLVRAVSADGTPSHPPASVNFRVLPPVWRRWWFISLALILLALPVVTVARYRQQRTLAVREAEEALRRSREERLVELEQVRRRIATDLHDDIGSSLSQVYLLSEVVRQRVNGNNSDINEPLAMIANASNEMVSSLSDIVWAINPQKDHLSDLVQRMRRFASDTFATRDIAFRFSAPNDETDVRLGANLRREIFLIYKESVNNLVKHSGCSEAEIEFQMADHSLRLSVSDNGKGFDATKDGDGHGLGSMRERAASIGGQFDLVSVAGQGTTMTLLIQLPQTNVAPATTNTGGNGAV